MDLIAIGRLRNRPEAELFDRYNGRLQPRLTVIELPEQKGTPEVIKRRESLALLAAMPRDFVHGGLGLGGARRHQRGFRGPVGAMGSIIAANLLSDRWSRGAGCNGACQSE